MEMSIGKYAVAYRHRRLTSLLEIVGKVRNKALAIELWGIGKRVQNKGQTWEYMYFLDKISDFDVKSPRTFEAHLHLKPNVALEVMEAIETDQGQIFGADEGKSDDELESELERQIKRGNYTAKDSWSK